MLFAVMCCKIPLSACFEYSRNISLSCSSHSLVFFSFSTLFFLQHSFSIFFWNEKRQREGGGEVRQSVVFWASWRSLSTCFPLSGRASISTRLYTKVWVCVQVCVCVCKCVSVCAWIFCTVFCSCFAIWKHSACGGISVLWHSLHQIRKTTA